MTLPKNYVQINVQDQIRAIHDTDVIEGEDFGLCKLFNIRFCQIKNEGWDFGLCNNLGFCKVEANFKTTLSCYCSDMLIGQNS
jgi:hypothetical protein